MCGGLVGGGWYLAGERERPGFENQTNKKSVFSRDAIATLMTHISIFRRSKPIRKATIHEEIASFA